MSFEEIATPFKSELFYYALMYNVRVKSFHDALYVLHKAIDSGHYDTAVNIIKLIMSNFVTSPYFIIPFSTNGIITKMFFIGDKIITQRKAISYHEGSKPVVVLAILKNRAGDEYDATGWKIMYFSAHDKYLSEPLLIWEIEKLVGLIKELGSATGIANEDIELLGEVTKKRRARELEISGFAEDLGEEDLLNER